MFVPSIGIDLKSMILTTNPTKPRKKERKEKGLQNQSIFHTRSSPEILGNTNSSKELRQTGHVKF